MAPMMVAPLRLVPGIMARHCTRPTLSAYFQSMSSASCTVHDVAVAFLRPQDHEAAQDEGAGHDCRREKVLLDGLAEQQAQNDGGQEGDQHVQREQLGLALGWKRTQRLPDLLPVHDDHGQDGAGLDRDVEDLGLLVVESQQRSGKDEVARAGDRKKLGQALDHPHHRGLDQQNNIQRALQAKAGLSLCCCTDPLERGTQDAGVRPSATTKLPGMRNPRASRQEEMDSRYSARTSPRLASSRWE